MSSHMYPENPEGTQIIVGSMNMGYISDTARNRTHNPFHPKQEPIPLGHNDGAVTTRPCMSGYLGMCVFVGVCLSVCMKVIKQCVQMFKFLLPR